VQARRYTSAGGCPPIGTVGAGVLPHIAVDATGALLVAYSADGQVVARRHSPATGWTAPRRLDAITVPVVPRPTHGRPRRASGGSRAAVRAVPAVEVRAE